MDETKYIEVKWEEATDTVGSGERHFRKIDSEKQYYDFHLSEKSKARDAGYVLANGTSAADHDGKTRSDIAPTSVAMNMRKKKNDERL